MILITIDTLRADHLTPYGYTKNTTPFLNSFSKTSLVYLNAVSQAGSTILSIPSLFTSRFPYADDVVSEISVDNDTTPYFKETEETLSKLLKNNGYYTKAIIGYYYLKSVFGVSQGFMNFDDNFTLQRRADEVTNLSINWLNSYKQEDLKKPFFLWLHYADPHCPYEPPKQYIEMFDEPFVEKEENYTYRICGNQLNISNKEIHKLKIAYDGEIRFVDDNLKILFDYLNKTKILDNSIIIITADHGESFGEHNIFGHNDIYYEIIHVPLIIECPNCSPKVITSPVSLVDIFPTIFDTLNIKFNYNIRGKNLFKNLNGYSVQFAEKESNTKTYTLIKNYYKLMIRGNNEMLFNIRIDPKETTDLKTTDEKIFEELKLTLMNILNSHHEINKTEINETAKREIEERLRELGYL